MFSVGEIVKWRDPLDEDYSYGTVLRIKKSVAVVLCSGYYAGIITEMPIKNIEKLERGGKRCGNSKKYRKRSTP